jgi:hypothetical protein
MQTQRYAICCPIRGARGYQCENENKNTPANAQAHHTISSNPAHPSGLRIKTLISLQGVMAAAQMAPESMDPQPASMCDEVEDPDKRCVQSDATWSDVTWE